MEKVTLCKDCCFQEGAVNTPLNWECTNTDIPVTSLLTGERKCERARNRQIDNVCKGFKEK